MVRLHFSLVLGLQGWRGRLGGLHLLGLVFWVGCRCVTWHPGRQAVQTKEEWSLVGWLPMRAVGVGLAGRVSLSDTERKMLYFKPG